MEEEIRTEATEHHFQRFKSRQIHDLHEISHSRSSRALRCDAGRACLTCTRFFPCFSKKKLSHLKTRKTRDLDIANCHATSSLSVAWETDQDVQQKNNTDRSFALWNCSWRLWRISWRTLWERHRLRLSDQLTNIQSYLKNVCWDHVTSCWFVILKITVSDKTVWYFFIQIAKKNSSKNTFIQKHFHPKEKTISSTTLSSKNIFIQKRRQSHPRHFHPKTGSSNDTFIQKHTHAMTLSSKNGFVQWHFHPKPFSSNPKPFSKP